MLERKLHTFLTLYDTMSYHETAARLHMTQPAVTQQIHALEREYGQKLFEYDHRVLSSTPAAQTLAMYGRRMDRADRLLRQELAQAQQPVLRVGATKTIGDFLLYEAAARYLADPAHKLNLMVANTAELLNSLEQDKIDFAVVEGNFDRQRYGSRLLRVEPFVGICAAGHRFAGRTVPLREVVAETLLLREPGSGTRGITLRMLDTMGYTPAEFARVVEMSSFGLLCRLTAAGSGVSFVYRAVADAHPGLATFEVEDCPVRHAFHYVFLRDCGAEALINEFGTI